MDTHQGVPDMTGSFSGRVQRRFAPLAALACLFAVPLAQAQHVAPMIPDASFGISGYAPIPSVDIATPGASPLGFVRLPLSGGYLMLSVQTVGGVSRVVASRFTEAGAVNTAWGSGGSLAYGGIPAPKNAASFGEAQARVVVNLEGSPAAEVIYLTGLYDDLTGRPNLMAARLGADGALLGFGNSELFGFIGGAASIDAVSPAGGDALYKGIRACSWRCADRARWWTPRRWCRCIRRSARQIPRSWTTPPTTCA
jgi:hypothetical protein